MASFTFTRPIGHELYQRDFNAEIDCLADDQLLVRGHMSDGHFALEHTWYLRTPDYEVLTADARQLTGQLDAGLCDRYREIRGVRIGRGFSKRVVEALGEGEGHREHLFLAIEMARVGQQVYQFPAELASQLQPEGARTNVSPNERARVAWIKDRSYMKELANSCYTYRDESLELFSSRDVHCGFDAEITHPQPGDKRVFWRSKRLLVRPLESGAYFCESAMADSIHDIQVQFEIDADAIIQRASSRGLRLPYHGICEDAQLRTAGLVGRQLTSGYVRQFADAVGGVSGCTHLFDLSIDCLRLFQFN